MRTIYTLLLACCLAFPAIAAEPLTITGPTEAIQPNEDAWLYVTSLTLDEIKAAKADETIHVTVYPSLDAQLHAAYDLLHDQPGDSLGLLFEAKYPADYLIEIDIVRSGKMESASIVVIVDGDEPRPDPRPDPEPDPDEIATWAIVVEERSDRTQLPANQRLVFESAKVRALMPTGQFLLVDRHTTDKTMALYVEQANQMDIPVMFLVSDDGDVVYSGPLPETVDSTAELLRKHTGGNK